jgi:hypothetical protein
VLSTLRQENLATSYGQGFIVGSKILGKEEERNKDMGGNSNDNRYPMTRSSIR